MRKPDDSFAVDDAIAFCVLFRFAAARIALTFVLISMTRSLRK